MSDTRKQTAFRLPRDLLAEVDVWCERRGITRTQAVEEGLRLWMAPSVAFQKPVEADAQSRDVSARQVEVPKTERLERAKEAAPVVPARDIRTYWAR